MLRKPNPRSLTGSFLLLSAALAVVVLANRNLYDDELASLAVVAGPVKNILRYTSTADVHPPGMYLLAHFAYLTLPSPRWLNLFPILFFYAGLCVFLLHITPLFPRLRSQICLLLLATLHPQVLLWCTSFRWYSWWTGISLIAVAVALQPGKTLPRLTLARALSVGLLLACLFYLNYITLLFAFALAAAAAVRYRSQPARQLLARMLACLAIFLILAAPQLHTLFAVHLAQTGSQRDGAAVSTLRLLQSLVSSEAYLPWHPLAILAALAFGGLAAKGLLIARRRTQPQRPLPPAIAAVTLLALLLFVLIAASGLGGKPRNGLVLIPLLAPIFAWIMASLRPRLQDATLLLLAVWCAVGFAHMTNRYGMTKATMNDRPEQVLAFVQQVAGSDCSVVATADAGLSFTLAQARLTGLLLLSTEDGSFVTGSRSLKPNHCARMILFVVHSYLGRDSGWAQTLNSELAAATQFFITLPKTAALSPDPDAARKRSLAHLLLLGPELAGETELPDFRYIVSYGPIDPNAVDAIQMRMPDFSNAVGTTNQPLGELR
jgi:hypothetical protein